MSDIPSWLSALAAIGTLLVSVIAPLFARATVTAGLKQTDALFELAMRLEQFENLENSLEKQREKGTFLRSRDALAQYQEKLVTLHTVTTFGLWPLTCLIAIVLFIALFSFIVAVLFGSWWLSVLAIVVGNIIAFVGVPAGAGFLMRRIADKKAEPVTDEIRNRIVDFHQNKKNS